MLRVACDGDNTGAEVSLNGQFKGECPFDLPLAEGSWTLRAVKRDGKERERVYETQFRIASGTVKRLDIELGAVQLTAEGEKTKQERDAQALRAAQDKLVREAQEKAAKEAELARVKLESAQELVRFGTAEPAQLQTSAQAGNANAMAALGESYLYGRGQLPQAALALRWFNSAAQAGNARGMAGLGYMIYMGMAPGGVESGKSWLRRAADANDAMGMYGWGVVLGMPGQSPDAAGAQAYLKRAADVGSTDARAMLAFQALTGQPGAVRVGEALPLLQSLAEKGSQIAAYNLWRCYWKQVVLSCPEIAKDDALGLPWLRAAAERGESRSMSVYGSVLNRGVYVPRDQIQAMVYWRRATEFGDPFAKDKTIEVDYANRDRQPSN